VVRATVAHNGHVWVVIGRYIGIVLTLPIYYLPKLPLKMSKLKDEFIN